MVVNDRIDVSVQAWNSDGVERTQIQLPDALYEEVKRVAREREMSLAEVVRLGVEYITRACPAVGSDRSWTPPPARNVGAFKASPEDWRLLVNEPAAER